MSHVQQNMEKSLAFEEKLVQNFKRAVWKHLTKPVTLPNHCFNSDTTSRANSVANYQWRHHHTIFKQCLMWSPEASRTSLFIQCCSSTICCNPSWHLWCYASWLMVFCHSYLYIYSKFFRSYHSNERVLYLAWTFLQDPPNTNLPLILPILTTILLKNDANSHW